MLIQNPKLDVNSKVCFNSNVAASVPTRKFIKLKMKEFENHYFIGQVVNELRSIYLGAPYEYKSNIIFATLQTKFIRMVD